MGGRGIRCGRITAFCSRTMNGCRSIWGLRAGNEDWNAPREIPRLAGENARLRDDAGEKTSTDGIRMTDPKTLSPLDRSEEHTSELQSPCNLVCRLLLENTKDMHQIAYNGNAGNQVDHPELRRALQ